MAKLLLISGHGKNVNGSYDPGAVSKWGQEAAYTRELATLVQESIGNGLVVDMYDQGKNCYSYSKAGSVPNYAAYDAVLEIHFNAKAKKDEDGDGKFTGIGAYCHPDNTGGQAIAEKIVAAVTALGFKKWQVCNSTGLYNLNKAQKAGIKYLLLETAFLDDGDDMSWYTANKACVAQAIAQTLIQSLGGSGNASVVGGGQESGKPAQTETYVTGMYRVICGDLNIRSSPGTEHEVVGVITDGGTYTVVEFRGSWGRLLSGAGWINCNPKYCTRVGDAKLGTDAEPEDNMKTFEVQVKIEKLNIRKGPGTNYRSIGYCPKGVYNITETVYADGHNWGHLLSGAGWIALDYVEVL